jgi:hypothetical protein
LQKSHFWHSFKFSKKQVVKKVLTMKKLACIVLTIILVFSALMFVPPTHAATYVNGNITSNATWARVNSPYQLTANVIVNQGVTLTIEAGTTVNFGNYQLQVNGVLNAQGNSVNKIVFTGNSGSAKVDFSLSSTNWNEASSSGCIIDNTIINYVTITVSGASPKISNNYITATNNLAITVSGGSPNISANTIIFNQANAIHITGGSPTISGNTISGADLYDGIYVSSSGSATISSNNIMHGHEGIEALGYCTITQNNILNNGNDGILTTNSGTVIQNNAIDNNKVGVSGTGGSIGTVQSNTISNNWGAGIWGATSTAAIHNNNIVSNVQNMHLTETGINVDASNNWWGTADQEAINQTIWDHKDASNLGTVNFVPFLTQLNPNAPTVPVSIPIPTAPPTPAPTSSATPTPTPTASPTPTIRPNTTPTPTPTQQPYNTQPPYQYPTATPYDTTSPTANPGEISNSGGEMDLTSVAVIAVAVMATLVIVFAINRTFGRGNKTPPQPVTNST